MLGTIVSVFKTTCSKAFQLGIGNKLGHKATCFDGAFTQNSAMSSASTTGIKYLKQDEAIKIDEELFNEYGFSVDQLMELAGLSCAHAVNASFPRGNVLVVAGPGNNGGDGFVCARHLKLFGYTPYMLYPRESKNDLMKRLVTQVTKMGIDFVGVDSLTADGIANKYSLVVDAMFGFSFKPPLRAPFDSIIQAVNDSKVPVFSIDIPSGWHVEQGAPSEELSIKPNVLISLTAPKLCARNIPTLKHFLGGRFVPQSLADKYQLNLPEYPNTDCIIKLAS